MDDAEVNGVKWRRRDIVGDRQDDDVAAVGAGLRKSSRNHRVLRPSGPANGVGEDRGSGAGFKPFDRVTARRHIRIARLVR